MGFGFDLWKTKQTNWLEFKNPFISHVELELVFYINFWNQCDPYQLSSPARWWLLFNRNFHWLKPTESSSFGVFLTLVSFTMIHLFMVKAFNPHFAKGLSQGHSLMTDMKFMKTHKIFWDFFLRLQIPDTTEHQANLIQLNR